MIAGIVISALGLLYAFGSIWSDNRDGRPAWPPVVFVAGMNFALLLACLSIELSRWL